MLSQICDLVLDGTCPDAAPPHGLVRGRNTCLALGAGNPLYATVWEGPFWAGLNVKRPSTNQSYRPTSGSKESPSSQLSPPLPLSTLLNAMLLLVVDLFATVMTCFYSSFYKRLRASHWDSERVTESLRSASSWEKGGLSGETAAILLCGSRHVYCTAKGIRPEIQNSATIYTNIKENGIRDIPERLPVQCFPTEADESEFTEAGSPLQVLIWAL